ncbi:MAG: type III pantothenate kinase [Phycisphaerae bacterium]
MSRTLQPAEAVLAVDIGNTRIGMAIWDDDGLHGARHVSTGKPSSWRPALEETWATAVGAKRRAVVIGSVGPRAAHRFADLATDVCDSEPLCVRDDLPLPMPLDVDNPREVGVDRVCAAAAAYDRIQACCAIASFGTATTVDCVSEDGRFLGGAILPGLEMSCDALHEHTARLPRVSPAAPHGVFAKNTHDAIVNGVVYAAVGALREIVERFATELRQWPQVLITGGSAPLIAETADFVDAHVPDLCLMGVALAYRKATGQA